MAKRVTVGDLKDQLGTPPRVFLYCRACGERNSAHAGDYFACRPAHVFKHCGINMVLAREECAVVPA